MPSDTVKWKAKRSKASCARGSFRIVKRGSTLVRVCCARKGWKKGRCRTGMKLQAIGKKRR